MLSTSVLFEATGEEISPSYAFDAAEPIALWLTVGVIAAIIAVGFVIFFAKRAIFGKYIKYAALGAVVYAAVGGIIMLSLEIAKKYSENYTDENGLNRTDVISYVFVPIMVTCALVLVGAVTLFLVSRFKPKAFRATSIVCGILALASVIVTAIMIGVHYTSNISDDGYFNSDTASVNNPILYVSAAVMIAAIVAAAFLLDSGKRRTFDTKVIVYAAVCIAMSFALSYVKMFEMPQGGSITLASLLPLMVFSYMYGTKYGVFAGFIYGFMQALQDPFIIQPAQFLLDYPIAFATIGLAGVFADFKLLDKLPQIKFALGAIFASGLRFIAHVLAGVFAFSAYAGDGNVWIYSMTYNSFVFVDVLITIVAGVVLFSSKSFVKTISKIGAPIKTKATVSGEESADGSVAPQADGLTHTDTRTENHK